MRSPQSAVARGLAGFSIQKIVPKKFDGRRCTTSFSRLAPVSIHPIDTGHRDGLHMYNFGRVS